MHATDKCSVGESLGSGPRFNFSTCDLSVNEQGKYKVDHRPTRYHITPQTGTAFTVDKGQLIRIIDVEAEMDLIVGVTACSALKCNNYRCTSIDVEIDSTHNST